MAALMVGASQAPVSAAAGTITIAVPGLPPSQGNPFKEGPGTPGIHTYAAIFDAGDLPEGPNSTVISVKDDGVMLRRQGAISLADLRSVTPNIAVPAL